MVAEAGVKTATRDGVKLAYLDAGSGDPALVFIHGWCCNQAMWRDQIPEFAPEQRVLALDLRGHGESDKPDQDYEITGFADDVRWLTGEIGLRQPLLIGHSMGGLITLTLIRRYPDLARAAMFVDSPIMPFPDEMRPLLDQTLEALKTPAYREIAANVVTNFMFREESPPQLRDEVAAARDAHGISEHNFRREPAGANPRALPLRESSDDGGDGGADQGALPGYGDGLDGRCPLRAHGEAGGVQRYPVAVSGEGEMTPPLGAALSPHSSRESLRTSGEACHSEPRQSRSQAPRPVARSLCIISIAERRISAIRAQNDIGSAKILRYSHLRWSGRQSLSSPSAVLSKRSSE